MIDPLPPRDATPRPAGERRLAVIDMGSGSFRLVVFTDGGDWWAATDEVYEAVRLSEGMEPSGALQPAAVDRAMAVLEVFAHFIRATGVEHVHAVATSAIRDATNQAAFLKLVKRRTGLDVDVLSKEREAHYGYLAAVNSTTIADGVVLDIGGGSMQLTRVSGRLERESGSWPLGAVRVTDRFLPGKGPAKRKHTGALREHVHEVLARDVPWLAGIGRRGQMTGLGGAVRNLASAAESRADQPTFGVQGYRLTLEQLEDLVAELASRPVDDRRLPGIKPERADVVLAAAIVIQTVMEHAGVPALETTEAGIREGVFISHALADREVPLLDDVRRAAVRNLVAQHHGDFPHTDHVAALATRLHVDLCNAGLHDGGPDERDLLWAAAMLHDVGTGIAYDDHHKHSRYLILNAGLPGYSPRETGLIAQMTRFHRKGVPSLQRIAPIARDGDLELLTRCSALLRVCEQLERARDQAVKAIEVSVSGDCVTLHLRADEDVGLARWAAERQGDVFERAFGKSLAVSEV